ncbi:MAG: hypothetical protein F6J89_22380 [Symploca sp. SIO1C4]|uniref:ATP-binding protein n=1 Tax=Symploca sp. SIO1C4 TaxID=2607765 RepID=A0A6B3NJI7_9CYAN|nr:hypothetical protein [Symploca sp. SIO1C4]
MVLKQIYNAFDPFRPLPAGDPVYVDCRQVRGDGDILVELGQKIFFSNQKTCQLYAGHRGAGKSTELLRLFNRCLLEYRYLDTKGEIKRWCDVHPLLKDTDEFREALNQVS